MLKAHVVRVLLLIAFAGVVRQRLYRRAWMFPAYLLAVLTLDGVLMSLFPERFLTWTVWAGSRQLYVTLKLLLVLEIGADVFQAFPRAMSVARASAALLVGSVALLALWTALTQDALSGQAFVAWSLRVNAAALGLLVLVALLTVWYNLPLDPWHRVLLLGFGVQIAMFGILLVILQEQGFASAGHLLSIGDPVIASWWAYSAWRPERARVPLALPQGA